MATKIDWATTAGALDGVLATLPDGSTTKKIGALISVQLKAIGSDYNSRYGNPGSLVDVGKDKWLAYAMSAHNDADKLCRYIEAMTGTAGPPQPFNPYDNAQLLDRCKAAQRKAPAPEEHQLVELHVSAVRGAYGDTQNAYTADQYVTQQVEKPAPEVNKGGKFGVPIVPAPPPECEEKRVRVGDSVRTTEIKLLELMGQADKIGALVAYVP